MPNTTHTRLLPLAAIAAAVGIAACNDSLPAEVRTTSETFQQTASWNASVSPVSPSTVRGTTAVKQFQGFRMTVTMSVTGTPNTTYQWRLFRDPCTSNAAASPAWAPTGLVLVSTNQSYPDIKTDATGAGTASATITGSLDSLTSYSARVRANNSAITWNGTSPIACGDLKRTAGAG